MPKRPTSSGQKSCSRSRIPSLVEGEDYHFHDDIIEVHLRGRHARESGCNQDDEGGYTKHATYDFGNVARFHFRFPLVLVRGANLVEILRCFFGLNLDRHIFPITSMSHLHISLKESLSCRHSNLC